MIKDIKIRQIHTELLCCEPMIERCANGELLCLCQCGGTYEPSTENRAYAFHSKDNGENCSIPRSPYEMWISSDNMETWEEKIRLTDFPGNYCYPDCFQEDGHIHLVVEHNRHTILYFDITL